MRRRGRKEGSDQRFKTRHEGEKEEKEGPGGGGREIESKICENTEIWVKKNLGPFSSFSFLSDSCFLQSFLVCVCIGFAAPTPQAAKQAYNTAKATATSSSFFKDAKADKDPLRVQRFSRYFHGGKP